jgi:hypothetical protein
MVPSAKPGLSCAKQGRPAFRDALKERARERAPLQWAATQNNLGNALAALGVRETGDARLEEAAAAYRDALQEDTRERMPLDWARRMATLRFTIGSRLKSKTPARFEPSRGRATCMMDWNARRHGEPSSPSPHD